MVAAMAKWEVVHEAKRIVNLFTSKPKLDAIEEHMQKIREQKKMEALEWRDGVLNEDDRTTKEASEAS